jgi:hypothetical protein
MENCGGKISLRSTANGSASSKVRMRRRRLVLNAWNGRAGFDDYDRAWRFSARGTKPIRSASMNGLGAKPPYSSCRLSHPCRLLHMIIS